MQSRSLIPSILKPLCLRSGVKFQDLKDHLFEEDEIIWLCEEMDKKHLPWEYQLVTGKAISKRYNIHIDGLRSWMKLYKDQLVPIICKLKCSSDNDCPFDQKSLKRIVAWQFSQARCPDELETIIVEELDNTVRRRFC